MKSTIKNIFFLLLFWLLSATSLSAQKNYKWDPPVPSVAIPEAFKTADAVIISNYENRQTYFEEYRFFSQNIIKRRIKILTELGLEKYGRIFLPKKPELFISILDARTIKKDGTIIDLDPKKDINSIELTEEDDFLNRTKYQVFSIPGLEVGDEFEMVCIHEGYGLERGATVVLHDFIPVLESKFTIETGDKRIIIMAANRNQMPKPEVKNNLNSIVFTWKANNLPGLIEERGNISAKTLPHFIYELNFDRLYRDAAPPNIENWRDLLLYINKQYFDVRIRKKKKFKETYAKIISTAKSDSKFDQLNAIQKYLNEVQLITIPKKEEGEGIEYFLEKKKADYNTLIKMYKSLLSNLGVTYQIAAGRSKFQGAIDLEFPTYVQITDFLFVVEENDNSHVLPLKTKSTSYGINEIPLDLTGTDIYLIHPNEKTSFRMISLPKPNHKKNVRLHKIKGKVKLKEKTLSYLSETTFGGAFSTLNRSRHYRLENQLQKYGEEQLEKQNIALLDSISLSSKPTQFPYRYKLTQQYQTKQQISELEKNVYNISLENFLEHTIQQVNENRLLDYYPSYTYTDAFSYYLEFDHAVKLNNKENLDRVISNDLGSFTMSINQSTPNLILIRSKYILKATHIPVSKIPDLISLNKAAIDADNQGIIISVED